MNGQPNQLQKLPMRKHIRLKNYDYSLPGAYFVTICAKNKAHLFGRIVGRGLAPAECDLSDVGTLVETELLALSERFPNVSVEKYIIMPNHVHTLLTFEEAAAGAAVRPTLDEVMRAFKSLITRRCNKILKTPGRIIWQASYYEHVVRNEQDCLQIWRYIDENPAKWREDKYYSEF